MNRNQPHNDAHRSAPALRWLWPLAHLCGLLATLWIAWWMLAQAAFFYPLWHQWLSIGTHIEYYGPRNRYRYGFERTDTAEHQRLFAQILDSIHRDGAGLAEIRYHAPDGQDLGPLLRPPEVQHLEDVARLVSLGRLAGLLSLGAWSVLVALLLWRRVPIPPMRRQFMLLLGLCVAATAAVLGIGPVKVFYAIHVWIFPPGHQWFFYYQESLMTTLMKAPDLFGGMAASWVLLTMLLVAGQWFGLSRWLRSRGLSPDPETR